MTRFVIRRLLLMIVVLFVISLVTFLLFSWRSRTATRLRGSPGDWRRPRRST